MKGMFRPAIGVLLLVTGFFVPGVASAVEAEALAEVTDKERCPVCGMFVAKHPGWVAQIRLSDGRVVMFDGPKDMLAFYFSPGEYGAGEATIQKMIVRDYYTQQWIEADKAHYVTGSDVYGPMGNEFVPFETREAAATFVKDHQGEQLLFFDEIGAQLVQVMRQGHKKMSGMKK